MGRIAFLSGLPRTGSTVLGTLLAQHPDLHSTRTSCVREMMMVVRGYRLGESPYYDLKDPNSPAWGIMRGMLHGAYEKVGKKVILEKDRAWPTDIGLLKQIIQEDPKIIATVRPLPEIIASFVLLSQRVPNSKIAAEVLSFNREVDIWNLSRSIWDAYVYYTWRSLKTGYDNFPECFLLLEYDQIVNEPSETMGKICSYLGVEHHDPITTGLKNPNPENDKVYGIPGLHDVNPELKRTSPPAREVLGDECYQFWVDKQLEFWQHG